MKQITWKHIMLIGALSVLGLCVSQVDQHVAAQGLARSNYDRVAVSNENYASLYENEKSSMAQNDPEMFNTMKRLIYGDIAQQAQLDDKQRQLITLVILVTNQNQPMLKDNIKASLRIGVTPIEIREAIYQTVPYIGFPKAFEALEIMNQIFKEAGISLPLPIQGSVTEKDRFDRGLAMQKSIYGEMIDQLRSNSPKDQMHIQDDLSAFCFGDIYTRGILDVKMRELLTLSVITALGGAEPQLKGHIQGNIKVGNDRKTIIGAITQAMPYIGFPRTLNALRCVNEIIPVQ